MPQFMPLYWLSLIIWILSLLTFLTWFNGSIALPSYIRLLTARTYITNFIN